MTEPMKDGSKVADLKKAIEDLMPMAKWYYGQYRDEKAKAIIERAKKLIDSL